MRNAEIFTYPSIHRFRRAALQSRRESDIIFLEEGGGGFSSVFNSDRVLAINDDAVFLGGRAALII